jgi:hypothetical protein
VCLLGGSVFLAQLDDLLRPTLLALWSLLTMLDAPHTLTDISGGIN